MPSSSHPEFLPAKQPQPKPRLKRAGGLFADENLDILAHLLDDCFRIPGTSIRFGLDGIIGLVPGLGDILAGLASCILILAAWIRGVPYIALVRMAVTVGIGVVVGTIPIFGDAFDIAWKANRRNYAVLVRHLEQPRRHTWRDWVFLLLLGAIMFVLFLLPLLLVVWVLLWLRPHR